MKRILISLYGGSRNRVRRLIVRYFEKREGGQFLSESLREIMKRYHHVEIGKYTHGGCFKPFVIDKHTVIGRYCSIAQTTRVMNRNHAIDRKSSHAYFFNSKLGIVPTDDVPHIPLTIGSDVWLGHNSIIMPSVRTIGHGAVVAAGAVVNKDVPPYAVMVGNPARPVRYRFPPEVIEKLLEEEWWNQDVEELDVNEMSRPVDTEPRDEADAAAQHG